MVYERLREIIAEQFLQNVDTITMETSFVDDLGADSLDAVDLIMRIEDEYGIPEVDEETVMQLHTVGDAFRFLSSRIDCVQQ
jgi:acyl carrier protein